MSDIEINSERAPSDDITAGEDYENPELVRAADVNERIVMRKNRVLYRELRRDFNPILAGLAGLMIGGIAGALLNQLVYSDMTVPLTAILGALMAVIASLSKNNESRIDQ